MIYFDVTTGLNRCSNCGQEWDNNIYALVEFPDDGTYFEQEDIGYPVFDREDNGARLVPEYECMLINDDEGLELFGSSAYWVPVKLLNKEV